MRTQITAAGLVFALSAPVSAQTYGSDNPARPILIGVILGVTIGVIIKLATAPPKPTAAKQIRAMLDPWIGGDVNDLIGKWGAPSSSFAMPDGSSQIYTWTYRGDVVSHPTGFGTARASQSTCRFDWTTAANRIESYRWEGSCRVDERAAP